ncbi:hypothetical protein CHS0354_002185 [Potamilus streckersoni]|uniref:SHSP domain-containing protein n=1 Tax=Potamilus streckersoni TaxID=2493646 RepID=A0AAE0RSD2_9BIVA|nr:hypothetical protein CHS0354_002185 [Potamilus streckersoni]
MNSPGYQLDIFVTSLWAFILVRLVPKYTNEDLIEEGHYEIMAYMDIPGLLHVKVQSCHSKNKIHLLWIQYKLKYSTDSIKRWHCTWKVGAMDVGCCVLCPCI